MATRRSLLMHPCHRTRAPGPKSARTGVGEPTHVMDQRVEVAPERRTPFHVCWNLAKGEDLMGAHVFTWQEAMRKTPPVVMLVVTFVACSEEPPATASEPPTQAVERSAATTPEEPSEVTSSQAAPPPPQPGAEVDVEQDARETYERILASRAAGDAAAYLAGFAPTLICFYGEVDVPRARIERRAHADRGDELRSIDLEVLRATDDEALLLDRGIWFHATELDTHEKLVLLRRDASGRFVITAETNASAPGEVPACAALRLALPDAGDVFTFCAPRTRRCTRYCASHDPGDGNFLDVCMNDCGVAAHRCFGLGDQGMDLTLDDVERIFARPTAPAHGSSSQSPTSESSAPMSRR